VTVNNYNIPQGQFIILYYQRKLEDQMLMNNLMLLHFDRLTLLIVIALFSKLTLRQSNWHQITKYKFDELVFKKLFQ